MHNQTEADVTYYFADAKDELLKLFSPKVVEEWEAEVQKVEDFSDLMSIYMPHPFAYVLWEHTDKSAEYWQALAECWTAYWNEYWK